MGRVYLAQDPNIDRKVALKVAEPPQDLAGRDEEELLQRFVLEARAAGQLNHPNIVAVYDAATDPGTGISFIAMEWVEGKSLAELLRDSEPLPLPQSAAIVEQVALALDSAHDQSLVHRDVKPGNILITDQGRAKISDFGIVKFASLSTTAAGQIVGSPYYMSPEQIRNESLDGRSDLFSLGVVLYQCVTGAVPFAGDSLATITYKILEIDPRPPQEENPEVPATLAAVIERALAKAPADRYQNGREFAAALRAVDLEAADAEEVGVGAVRTPVPPALSSPGSAQPRSGKSGTLLLSPPEPVPDGSSDPTPRPRAYPRPLSRRPWAALAALAVVSVLALWTIPREPDSTPPPQVDSSLGGGIEVDEQATPAIVAPGMASLQISYKNGLRSAAMTVWVDGEEIWSRQVGTSKGLLKRAVGEEVRAMLQIPEGRHRIRVRIAGASGKLGGSKSIEGDFTEGERRRLGAQLIPPDVLRLSWKD